MSAVCQARLSIARNLERQRPGASKLNAPFLAGKKDEKKGLAD